MANPRRCQALNKQGRPCGAPPLREGSLCFAHAPETKEAAAEARRLGGRRRRREGTIKGAFDLEEIKTGAGLRRILEVALLDVFELENSVPRARTLAYLVSVAARVQEQTEFEACLRALEAGVWREVPDADSQAPAPRIVVRHPDGRGEERQRDAPQEDPDAAA